LNNPKQKKTSWWFQTNPVEKYARQNGNLPQVRVKIKKYLKPPPLENTHTQQKKTPQLFMIRKSSDKFGIFWRTSRKFNIAPENCCLEECFPIGKVWEGNFSGAM